MELTLEGLEQCFNEAASEGAEYVAVQIEMDGFPSDEIIINDNDNITSKLAYYKKTYNEELEHRYAPGIRIVGFAHGYSFLNIEHKLGLLEKNND
ncbi:hypothetical protein CN425_22885 [Bacillus cereus]|uniref:Uncharacterized protein n=1 Tax=Bacillus cereus TaxID=1396 RepID=A0A2A8PQV7_BACCE|nr:hypothetical protein [Bacillus cereus]PEA10163.1 hypothetical protein CON38_07895 [Bacillus cereus]PEV97477.1 hypothetical protein CN425_22885 [Bacillus cereus]PFI25212.1 hypothetical protein COI75_08850 [Bacillus cereus]